MTYSIDMALVTLSEQGKVINVSADQSCRQVLDRHLDNADETTLLEIRIENYQQMIQVAQNYPLPWRFISDRRNDRNTSPADLADYFDDNDKTARLLRCYDTSTKLWSDKVGAPLALRGLLEKTDLYLSHPIQDIPAWIARRNRPGGSGGDLSGWIN